MEYCSYCSRPKRYNTPEPLCNKHYRRWWRYGVFTVSTELPIKRQGYIYIWDGEKRVQEHRYIMEKHLGRKLKKSEVVHHINHDRSDNGIENLMLIESHSKHISEHHPKKVFIDWKQNNKVVKPGFVGECRITECKEKTRSLGLCQKHYLSYRRNFLNK